MPAGGAARHCCCVEIGRRPATESDRQFLWLLEVNTMSCYFEPDRRTFDQRFAPNSCVVIVTDGTDVDVLKIEEQDGDLYLARL